MQKPEFRSPITGVGTIVVKIGSRILTSPEGDGYVRRVENLITDLAALRSNGMRVLVVTSGAVAMGVEALGLTSRPKDIPLKQACASIGQIRLMHMYDSLFSRYGICTGQVLLTWDDLRDKKRYLNLRNTLFKLFECNAIPIINENDSVGIEEIRFGDNDTLGAQLSLLIQADLFVILTDLPGLYDANPRKVKARHIPLVERMTPEIHAFADEKGSSVGVGGMVTKLKAAEIVTRAGHFALIGDGFNERLFTVLESDSAATLFLPSLKKMSSKHKWIAFSGKARGSIMVDSGASRAIIRKGTSLLPAGIKQVTGTFSTGDTVEILDESGRVFAKGIVNYASNAVEKICGLKSGEIRAKLGRKTFDEVIHRDNLAILDSFLPGN